MSLPLQALRGCGRVKPYEWRTPVCWPGRGGGPRPQEKPALTPVWKPEPSGEEGAAGPGPAPGTGQHCPPGQPSEGTRSRGRLAGIAALMRMTAPEPGCPADGNPAKPVPSPGPWTWMGEVWVVGGRESTERTSASSGGNLGQGLIFAMFSEPASSWLQGN